MPNPPTAAEWTGLAAEVRALKRNPDLSQEEMIVCWNALVKLANELADAGDAFARQQVEVRDAKIERLTRGLQSLCLCKGHKKTCGPCQILEAASGR